MVWINRAIAIAIVAFSYTLKKLKLHSPRDENKEKNNQATMLESEHAYHELESSTSSWDVVRLTPPCTTYCFLVI